MLATDIHIIPHNKAFLVMKLAAKALKPQYLHPRLCFAVDSALNAQSLGQKARFLLTYIAYQIHQ